MALSQVSHYYARWSLEENNGRVALYQGDQELDDFTTSNPEEFQAVVDLLRNEKPIVYQSNGRQIRAGSTAFGSEREPVGDEETP